VVVVEIMMVEAITTGTTAVVVVVVVVAGRQLKMMIDGMVVVVMPMSILHTLKKMMKIPGVIEDVNLRMLEMRSGEVVAVVAKSVVEIDLQNGKEEQNAIEREEERGKECLSLRD
jgi:hypothetical protein